MIAPGDSSRGETPRGGFAGVWIGESMGATATGTVIWRIAQTGRNLFVYPRDEGENDASWYYSGEVDAAGTQFRLNSVAHLDCVGRMLDIDHFVMTNWDRSAEPACDVVFSRPGLPELTARGMWEKSKE